MDLSNEIQHDVRVSEIRHAPVFLEVRDENNPERPASAWVLVERLETYRLEPADQTIAVAEASITLSYQLLRRGLSAASALSHKFVAHYDGQMVNLTNGAVSMNLDELLGRGIGSYLFNELAKWARQWPSAQIREIRLSPRQAGQKNRERRNHFYERVGIEFDYDDPVERRAGRSIPMLAGDLTPQDVSEDKIGVHSVRQYIERSLEIETSGRRAEGDAERWVANYRRISSELNQARRRPIRWALIQVRPRITKLLVLIAMIAAVAFATKV
jgi:GNAT superfamily N-acetyltransferase